VGDRHASLLVVSAYPPNKGRLSEYAHMLIERLASKGLVTDVLADVEPTPSPPVDNLRVMKAWTPDDPLSLLKLPSSILRHRPRVVMFNAHFAVFGARKVTNFVGFLMIWLVTKLERMFGFRTMVILHNLPETVDTELFGVKPSFLNRLGLLLAEKFALGCDSVVVTVEMYRKMIQRRFGRSSSYIPHGAWNDLKSDDPPGDRRDSLLFLGYMSPGKDMRLLATAFGAVRAKHPDLKLKLVTSPHPSFPLAVNQLKALEGIDGVEFIGYLPKEELPSLFNRCVALVLPYLTATGTSGVLHLVSAAGLPVVATDLPELRENLAEGAGLLLVKDADEMARTLNQLVEDGSLWNAVSKRSKAFSESRSWEIVSSKFYGLIKTLELQ